MMNKEAIKKFINIISEEIGELLVFDFNNKSLFVKYRTLTIIIQKSNSEKGDYCEIDLLDALCRLRLLIVEKLNRDLPNDKRHYAFKDLEILKNKGIKSFYKTDFLNEIIINYEK